MSKTREELRDYAEARVDVNGECDVLKDDCDISVYMLDNCEITVPAENRFFVTTDVEGIEQELFGNRAKRFDCLLDENGLRDGNDAMAYTGVWDFSHTNAEWDSIVGLGIFGLRERIAEYAEKKRDNEQKQRFFSNLLRVYDAALRFMNRSAEAAAAVGKTEMAKGLRNLCSARPKTLFEAMQTTIVYYVLQLAFDGTYLRTLGRLDSLLYPFYINEDKNVRGKMLLDYIREIDRLKAPSNIPFAVGGRNVDGESAVNELSYALVETYDRAQTSNTKLHILCSDNMQWELAKLGLDSVRRGNNSIVFMSDEKVTESLIRIGAEPSDAARYHIVGCYECGAEGELTCSCNARVNVAKALEYTLNGGVDLWSGKLVGMECRGEYGSFDELYAEFEKQLEHLCRGAMKSTDLYEMNYRQMHSAPIMSGTYTSALEQGGDLYCDYTAKYNNSSLNAVGLATAVDALAAVKKAVFDDKLLTLNELKEILRANWAGHEPLRLLIKNRYPKFGQGNTEIDDCARRIVKKLAKTVSGKPNAKGGVWRLGLFSIDWRWEMGRRMGASADGRLAGETISQNTSATFGSDKFGATAHLSSVAAIDAADTPNGAIADIDIHSSAVCGDNGLAAMLGALKAYFELGGFAVQYNVLNTEVLKAAKLAPEKYPNLQVRLCGWNVLFSSLSEKEKDEFIARSEK